MMARHRFYAPEASGRGLTIPLPSGEAQQLRRVLRLKAGATVQVFDGHGHEFLGQVTAVDRTSVTVRTLDALEPAHEPRVHLTMALSVLKGRAVDRVVRDATMLGATVIRPMRSDRSQPVSIAHSHATVARWQAIAISSAKQCRRAVVPTVHEVVTFQQLLSGSSSSLRLMLVEPMLDVEHDSIAVLAERPAPASVTIAVGPEGGWTDAEVAAAIDAGFLPLTLGSRTLRADAAPAAAIAVLQFVWKDL